MLDSERYPYVSTEPALGEAGFRPSLPLTLSHQQSSVTALGLLDTGATVNVLPYLLGIELGYKWEKQTTELNLTGNLAQFKARAWLTDKS
jgi:hypothetical protein